MRRKRRRSGFTLAALVALAALQLATGTAAALPQQAKWSSHQLGNSVHAWSIAFDSGGHPWFAGYGATSPGVVGRIEPDGSVVEYPVGVEEPANAIVAGPDGAMWFTATNWTDADFGAGTIGRVGEGGQIERFPLAAGTDPEAITVGPEGSFWFVERGVGRIGRMTPAGELAEFPVGRPHQLADIATGPDGNVWLTLRHPGEIGRITPAGEVTLYPLARGIVPEGIVGAAGALWFTETSGHRKLGDDKLGRISTGGRVKQFHVPARYGTGAIAAGPGGRIWFSTGPQQTALESISPQGKLGRRFCLDSTCTLPPAALAFAPDGALWLSTGPGRCLDLCGGGSAIALALQPGYVGRFLGAAGSRHPTTRRHSS